MNWEDRDSLDMKAERAPIVDLGIATALANAIERNGAEDPFDLELHLSQTATAVAVIRAFVAASLNKRLACGHSDDNRLQAGDCATCVLHENIAELEAERDRAAGLLARAHAMLEKDSVHLVHEIAFFLWPETHDDPNVAAMHGVAASPCAPAAPRTSQFTGGLLTDKDKKGNRPLVSSDAQDDEACLHDGPWRADGSCLICNATAVAPWHRATTSERPMMYVCARCQSEAKEPHSFTRCPDATSHEWRRSGDAPNFKSSEFARHGGGELDEILVNGIRYRRSEAASPNMSAPINRRARAVLAELRMVGMRENETKIIATALAQVRREGKAEGVREALAWRDEGRDSADDQPDVYERVTKDEWRGLAEMLLATKASELNLADIRQRFGLDRERAQPETSESGEGPARVSNAAIDQPSKPDTAAADRPEAPKRESVPYSPARNASPATHCVHCMGALEQHARTGEPLCIGATPTPGAAISLLDAARELLEWNWDAPEHFDWEEVRIDIDNLHNATRKVEANDRATQDSGERNPQPRRRGGLHGDGMERPRGPAAERARGVSDKGRRGEARGGLDAAHPERVTDGAAEANSAAPSSCAEPTYTAEDINRTYRGAIEAAWIAACEAKANFLYRAARLREEPQVDPDAAEDQAVHYETMATGAEIAAARVRALPFTRAAKETP